MIRLILIAAFVAVLAIAITAAIGTMRAIDEMPQNKDQGMLPGKLSQITYILLLLLLLGVTSGLLGAA